MRIDSHIHLFDPVYGEFAWPPRNSDFFRLFSAENYAKELGGEETGAVVVGCSNEYELNEKLCADASVTPGILGFIAQFNPADPGIAEYAEKLAVYPAYRGFRCDGSGIAENWSRIRRAILPGTVLEILGEWQDLWSLRPLLAENPDISFVIEHFGIYLFDGKPMPEDYLRFCREFAALPNVSMKLSGMYTLCRLRPKTGDLNLYLDVFRAALEAFGPERCMYGSDWPVLGVPVRQSDELAEACLKRVTEDPAVHAMVFGESAKRIYGLKI